VASLLTATKQERSWGLADRRAHIAADVARLDRNAGAAAASQPLEYFYRSLYLPEQGMFCQLPADFNLGHIAEVCPFFSLQVQGMSSPWRIKLRGQNPVSVSLCQQISTGSFGECSY